MRLLTAPAWIFVAGSVLFTARAAAQQPAPWISPDSRGTSQFTPLAVEAPRTLPPQAVRAPASRYPQPPVNFRLASAEVPGAPSAARPSLPLAPRSQASRSASGGSSRPVTSSPANALATVVGSLGAVLGLFLLVVWFSRRFAPAGAAVLPKEAVELLGRAPLAARQQMQLVRVGNKLLLVVLSPVGVVALTEITEPSEVEHLTALCRRSRSGTSSAAFSQALAQLSNEPAERGFLGAARPTSRGVR